MCGGVGCLSGFILKKGEAEYVVPEATNKLETVDIYAAQQAKDKAKRAAAKKEMTQEELDELEAHKVAAKKARQVCAPSPIQNKQLLCAALYHLYILCL